MSQFNNLLVVVLAGGRSSRMGGGHKCLLPLGNQLIIDRVLASIDTNVQQIILSMSPNSDIATYLSTTTFSSSIKTRLIYLADNYPEFSGPLAGITTAIHYARNHKLDWVVSVSADTPFLPSSLVERLTGAVKKSAALIGVACVDGHTHPTCGIWHTSLYPIFDQLLLKNQFCSLHQLLTLAPSIKVDFSCPEFDHFFNINTPDDFAVAESILVNIPSISNTHKELHSIEIAADSQYQ